MVDGLKHGCALLTTTPSALLPIFAVPAGDGDYPFSLNRSKLNYLMMSVVQVQKYPQYLCINSGPNVDHTELERGKMTSLVVPHSRPSAKARSEWRVAAAAASGIVLLVRLSMVGTVF